MAWQYQPGIWGWSSAIQSGCIETNKLHEYRMPTASEYLVFYPIISTLMALLTRYTFDGSSTATVEAEGAFTPTSKRWVISHRACLYTNFLFNRIQINNMQGSSQSFVRFSICYLRQRNAHFARPRVVGFWTLQALLSNIIHMFRNPRHPTKVLINRRKYEYHRSNITAEKSDGVDRWMDGECIKYSFPHTRQRYVLVWEQWFCVHDINTLFIYSISLIKWRLVLVLGANQAVG